MLRYHHFGSVVSPTFQLSRSQNFAFINQYIFEHHHISPKVWTNGGERTHTFRLWQNIFHMIDMFVWGWSPIWSKMLPLKRFSVKGNASTPFARTQGFTRCVSAIKTEGYWFVRNNRRALSAFLRELILAIHGHLFILPASTSVAFCSEEIIRLVCFWQKPYQNCAELSKVRNSKEDPVSFQNKTTCPSNHSSVWFSM